jgi:hypothetical protein
MSILLHNERERVAVATFTPFDMAAAWNGSKMAQQLLAASNVLAPSNVDTIMEDVLELPLLPLLPTMELFTEVTQEQECGDNDPSVHSNFRLQTNYNNLREVWNQRYGIDQHGDV